MSGVYAITPDLSDTAQLVEDVAAALAGGIRLLQYRNKQASAALRLEQAQALGALCRSSNTLFIINDDARLAARVEADGVHLGAQDASIHDARQIFGRDKIIGVSCYDDLERASVAAAQGADYLAFGSFFSSPSKPDAARAGLPLLQQARRQFSLPLVAIGGIDRHNGRSLINAGADALAVISALFAADNIETTARDLGHLFDTENHDFTQ